MPRMATHIYNDGGFQAFKLFSKLYDNTYSADSVYKPRPTHADTSAEFISITPFNGEYDDFLVRAPGLEPGTP